MAGLGFSQDTRPAPIIDRSIDVTPRIGQLNTPGIDTGRRQAPLGDLSPLAKVSALLQNFSRGVEGQPLYTDELKEQRAQQEALDLKKIEIGTMALSKGMELLKNTPAEKRADFAHKYAVLYPMFPDLEKTLVSSISDPSDAESIIASYGPAGRAIWEAAGRNIERMPEVTKNQALMKVIIGNVEAERGPKIIQAIKSAKDTLAQIPGGQEAWAEVEKNGVDPSDFQNPAFLKMIGLDQSDGFLISTSENIQGQLRGQIPNFRTSADTDTAAAARIKAENAPAPSGTRIIREEDGKKFSVFVNPKTGKEMFSIPMGSAADGQKVTGADIRAAVALRLSGKDPSDSGLPQGAINATEGMDEKQLLALGGQLAGGGINIRQTKDGLEIQTGSMATQKARSQEKIAEEGRKLQEATLNLFTLGQRTQKMAADDPNSINFGGAAARTIDNFVADVVGTAALVGYDVRKNLDLPTNDPNKLTTLDPSEAPDALFGGLANRSAAFKSAVFQLAVAQAAAIGQEGKGLSDKDLAMAIDTIGGNTSSIGQLVAKTEEIMRQQYERVRNHHRVYNQDPETGEAPPFPTFEEMKAMAAGTEAPKAAAAKLDGKALFERAKAQGNIEGFTQEEVDAVKVFRGLN